MIRSLPFSRRVLIAARSAVAAALAITAIWNCQLGDRRVFAEDPPARGDADVPAPAGGHPFPHRIPAPALAGGKQWLNAAGPIEMRDLRGKFVVLDFWTYCCINCMHILPELKKLEHAYPDQIVVIGVHSAKFDTEKGTDNIRQAILRYDIEHPVVNDADHVIWRRYGITGWPALRVVDPEGNLIAMHGGEITFDVLDGFFKRAIPYYKKRGLLDETPVRFDLERRRAKSRPLKFPGKLLADAESDRLYVSDSGHHRIVVADLAGNWIETIGSGTAGADDGAYDKASFRHPQGMSLHKGALYVADTNNHLIRKIDLRAKQVSTCAGVGRQNRGAWPGMDRIKFAEGGAKPEFPDRWASDPRSFALASPWSLLAHKDHLYIAMAGPHQIWRMSLTGEDLEVFAGNGREDISDGIRVPSSPPRIDVKGYEAAYASFAQPSGLATDGRTLYVADSEGSAVRAVPLSGNAPVRTVVGQSDLPRGAALFSFGDQDGKADAVRLQHVLGVAYHDGQLFIADTYNNKIKRIDIQKQTATTLLGDGTPGATNTPARFDEPEGLSYAANKLYIADTNNHVIRVADLATGNAVTTLPIVGLRPPRRKNAVAATEFPNAQRVRTAATSVRSIDGTITLTVDLTLPSGWKINKQAPLSYRLTAKGNAGPIDRSTLGKSVVLPAEHRGRQFEIRVPVSAESGVDQIELSLTCYYCRKGAEGLCRVASVRWTVPVTVSANAAVRAVTLRHEVR